MSLTFDNEIEWEGTFVSLGDNTFEKKVELTGEQGKDPIKDYAAGGFLAQGPATFKDVLNITKMKFMAENVEKFEKKVTITGPAVGTIKNCQDIKSLEMTKDIETRVVRSHVKEDFKVDTARGEFIDTQVDQSLNIEKSGMILRNILIKKDLSAKECYFLGSRIIVQEDASIEKSYVDWDTIATKTLTLKDTKLKGRDVIATDSYSEIENSIVFLSKFGTKTIESTNSKLYGQEFQVIEGIECTNSTVNIDEAKAKNITLNNTYFNGTNFAITEDISLNTSLFDVGMLTCKNITSTASHMKGRFFTLEEDLSLTTTISNFDNIEAKNITSTGSHVGGSFFRLTEDITYTNSSSLINKFSCKNLTTYSSYINGTRWTISSIPHFNQSSINIDQFTTLNTLFLTDSYFNGSNIYVSNLCNFTRSAASMKGLRTSLIQLTSSSFLGQMTTSEDATIDSGSSLAGFSYQGDTLNSSGSALLTTAMVSPTITDHGFIGISVVGNSNLSSLQGGVDTLAIERINNRTKDQFVAKAVSNIFIVTESDLLLKSEYTFLESNSATTIEANYNITLNTQRSLFLISMQDTAIMATGNYSSQAAMTSFTRGGQGLLCESGGSMNLIASADQLLQGGQVYVVSGGVPKFTPPDFCTAIGCSKPVWKEGGTSKSVNQPTEIPILLPPPELPD